MTAAPDSWRLIEDDDTLRRAFAAYFRYAGDQSPIPATTSYCCEFQGKRYACLENVNGLLAVYRVRNDGKLKRLRRWPAGLPKGDQPGPNRRG